MLRRLEQPRRSATVVSQYSREDTSLPFGVSLAQRRNYRDHIPQAGATSSDGKTTGNDGSNPADNEGFDFINDD